MALGPVVRGEPFTFGFQLIDDADGPFKLAGYAVRVTIRDAAKTPLIEAVSGQHPRLAITESGSAFDLFLTAEETAGLPVGASVVVRLGYPSHAVPDGFEWDQAFFEDALSVVTI